MMAEQNLTIIPDKKLETTQMVNTALLEKQNVVNSLDILREKARNIVSDAELDLASTRAKLETRYVAEIIKRDSATIDIGKRYDSAIDKINFFEGGVKRIQREIDQISESIFNADDLDELQLNESKLKIKFMELNSYKKDLKIYRDEFYRLLDILNIKESFSDPNSGKMNIGIFSNNQPKTSDADSSISIENSKDIPIEVQEIQETKDAEFSSKPKIETFFDEI